MARVLGVIRLSRDTDESTSVERQRQYIAGWAEQNGHEIVGYAEDVDVSGSVSPFERPELGRWLDDPTGWDVLVAWRLDRVTRRLLHLASLMEWLKEHGKTLATTSEGFDLSSAMGRVFVQILGALAEGELEAIKERAAASSRHLITTGRWRGGIVPYGYRPAPSGKGAGMELEPDPETAGVVREIVRRIIDCESANSVTRWLNDSGVPTPQNSQRARLGKKPVESNWRCANLLRLLKSPKLLGQAEMTETVNRNGKTERVTRVVRGADGLPLQRADPLITDDEWSALQAALGANGKQRSASRKGGSLLLRVAYCECGEPLYTNRGRTDLYYRCGSHGSKSHHCGNPSIAATELESVTVEAFLTMIGGQPMTRLVLVPGDGRAGQLAEVQRAIDELTEDRAAGVYSSKAGTARFQAMMSKLNEQAEALEIDPGTEDEWRAEPTGTTYREHWVSMISTEDRNRALCGSGMRVVVHRESFDDGEGGTSRIAVALDAERMTDAGDRWQRLTVDNVETASAS